MNHIVLRNRTRLILGILAILAGLFSPVLYMYIVDEDHPIFYITLSLFVMGMVLVGISTIKNKAMIWRKMLAYFNIFVALYLFGLGFWFILDTSAPFYPYKILFALPIFTFGVIPLFGGIKLLRKKNPLWTLASICIFPGVFYVYVALAIYSLHFN